MLWVIAEIYAILELQKNNLDTKKELLARAAL